MNKPGYITLIMVNMLCVLCTLASGQTITGDHDDYRSTITREYSVQPGGNLILISSNGDITVSSWNQNNVQIVLNVRMDVYTQDEARAIVEKLTRGFSQTGSTITVSSEDMRHSGENDYIIKVPSRFNLDLKTAGGDVSIEDVQGNVKAMTSGGDLALAKLSGDIDVQTSGGDLDFETISGTLEASTSGGDVTAIGIAAQGSINTSGGDITLEKISGKMKVNTSGGDISLQSIKEDVMANTSGGDITLTEFDGKEASLNTMGGDLVFERCSGRIQGNTTGGDISGTDLDGAVHVKTMGGEIELKGLRAPATAATTGGDIHVELTLKDLKAPHALDLVTMGGDVTVTLPAGLPASIEAVIHLQRGERFGTRHDIYSDFPLSKQMPDETKGRILRSIGDINGGGDRVHLETTGGDIYIKKAQ